MSFAENMAAALVATGDPLTFVDGWYVITVSGFAASGNEFRVAHCSASRDGVEVFNDDLLIIDPPLADDALVAAQSYIAEVVRQA